MTVTPHDIGTALVTSETNEGDSYIVDIKEGTCSCDAFLIYKQPCKHLDAARVKAAPTRKPDGTKIFI